MAMPAKIKYWALNYFYMSVGKDVPADSSLGVPDVHVVSEYENMFNKPLEHIANTLGLQPSAKFAADVQAALKAAKLPCFTHLMYKVAPLYEKAETLEEATLNAVNKFKSQFMRCVAMSKDGKAFSTYATREGQLIGEYPSDVVFVGFSKDIKIKEDLVAEMLKLTPGTCTEAYLAAIRNMDAAGMFSSTVFPTFDFCGLPVTIKEYAYHTEILKMLESMPDVYSDKWEALIDHLERTEPTHPELEYLRVRDGKSAPTPDSTSVMSIVEKVEALGLPEAVFDDPDNFFVADEVAMTDYFIENFGADVTLRQIKRYLETEGEPLPQPEVHKTPTLKELVASSGLHRDLTLQEILEGKTEHQKPTTEELLAMLPEDVLKPAEEKSDDYFLEAGMEILKTARKEIWADPSPMNRLKWSPCVHAFLRMLMGVEANKKNIREHLTRLAEEAENPATKELLSGVVNKYL